MQARIIENNARRNGEITINGWDIDTNDVEIKGSEKQIAWCRDILRDIASREIAKAGKALKLMDEVCTTESDWAKLEPQIKQFLAQLTQILDGVEARVIIDNRYNLQALIAAAKA